MKREFYILHVGGVSSASAETAATALHQTFVPGGYKHALAVVRAEIVQGPSPTDLRAWRGTIGMPATSGEGKGK